MKLLNRLEEFDNMSDEEFVRNEEEMFYDAKFNASLEAAGEMPEGGGEAGGERPAMPIRLERMVAPR